MDFAGAVEHHLAAVSARDLPTYTATLHDDVAVVLPDGKLIEGRAAVTEFNRDWFADPDWSWTLEPIRSVSDDSAGVALFAVTYDDLDADGKPYAMNYLLSLTFTRPGDRWLLLHDQNTLTT